ncbi:MAG: hypothetical protein ACI352_01255 [Elusimicrobiaceae bacterium]
MAIQTVVNRELPIGVPGEFYDNTPRRVHGYIVKAEGETLYIAAMGNIYFNANPADGDTVTVGETVYTFKTNPAASSDVAIGESTEASSLNLFQAINGGKEGGVKNPLVAAASYGEVVTVVAEIGGEAGNSVALAATGSALSVSGPTLAGGGTSVQEAQTPYIARAYTIAEEGKVRMGGNGIFAGIAVSPKEYALRGGLTPSLALANGTAVSIADMGHIVVQVKDAVSIGQAAYYDQTTGEIGTSGMEIKGSKFVFFDAEAGGLAVLELTGFGAV